MLLTKFSRLFAILHHAPASAALTVAHAILTTWDKLKLMLVPIVRLTSVLLNTLATARCQLELSKPPAAMRATCILLRFLLQH